MFTQLRKETGEIPNISPSATLHTFNHTITFIMKKFNQDYQLRRYHTMNIQSFNDSIKFINTTFN